MPERNTTNPGRLNFITTNPATEAFREGEAWAQQRYANELANERAALANAEQMATAPTRLRMINAQADLAAANAQVAQGTAQPRITEAEVSARYAEPRAIAGLRQQNAATLNTEMQGFYKSLDLMNQGRFDEADAVARAIGQQIPPEVKESAEVRNALTAAARYAQEAYPNRPRDQQAYITGFIQDLARRRSQGRSVNDPTAIYNVPNAPVAPIEAARPTYEIIHRQEMDPNTGQPVIRSYKFDKTSGEMTPIEGEGPFTKSVGAGAGGRMSVFQQKQAAWLAVHPGDAKGALEYASGRRQMSEAEIAKAALQMAGTEIRGNQMLRFRNIAEQQDAIQKRAAEIAQQIRTGFGQQGSALPGTPPGAGTRDNPFQATTQAHVDWFKANAPAGAVISINGQLYTK